VSVKRDYGIATVGIVLGLFLMMWEAKASLLVDQNQQRNNLTSLGWKLIPSRPA
jgi:hypothetical protein